jgi:glycosyltransferase involved in cell wall biosynthesis
MLMPASSFSDTLEFMRDNDRAYRAAIDVLRRLAQRSPEATLWAAQAISEFLQERHTGRFADGAIENVVLSIGWSLDRARVALPRRADVRRRHVLHVATAMLPVGGHSRTIRNWIVNDPQSRHSLVITSQGTSELPSWLTAHGNSNVDHVVLLASHEPLVERAVRLREIARSADVVVLHHFGCDVVPIAALAVNDVPAVSVVNHADHIFWLGSTIADVVVNQRPISAALGPRRRVRGQFLLPIPLQDRSPIARDAARDQLRIPREQLMLLSVGRASKYTRSETHDFLRTARRILGQNPQAHLHVIGVNPNAWPELGRSSADRRIHLLGEHPDAGLHQASADVYIEGFPFGSQTAFLEAALAGVPGVRAYAPPSPLLVTDDESLSLLGECPRSEDEYVAAASALARDPQQRRELGRQLRNRVLACHTGSGWRDRLEQFYAEVHFRPHRPGAIDELRSEFNADDVGIASWQLSKPGGRDSAGAAMRRGLLGAAYGATEVGDARAALMLLAQCGREGGWNGRLAAAVAKVPAQVTRARVRRIRARLAAGGSHAQSNALVRS